MSTTPARRATDEEMTKIRELVSDIEVAMLTTTGTGGHVRGRPMGTVLDPDEAAIWLFVAADSATAGEAARYPHVGLQYADPERDRYVSIAGTVTFVRDRDRIRELWRDEFAKWFPGGPDASSLVLLRVRIAQVEYWDDSSKLMRSFFDTIGAPFSGVPPEAVGEHARVRPE